MFAPSAQASVILGFRRKLPPNTLLDARLHAVLAARTDGERDIEECELVAWLMHLQRLAGNGRSLGNVAGFRTPRTEYRVGGNDRVGYLLTRIPASGPAQRLHGVTIDAQQIAVGAPVALYADGRLVLCTGTIVSVEAALLRLDAGRSPWR